MSASSKMITGALPPSSRCTRLRSDEAALATSMPARTEPVIATSCGVGCDDERAAGVAVAADHVEDAGREELGGDLGHQQRRDGRRVARLEHDAVARGERRPDLPRRHQQRVVPGRHLADDADRLAPDERRHAAHVLAGRAPFEHARGAREEADLVDHRRELLRGREPARLAGVLDLGVDELVRPRLDRVSEAQQRELTLGGRRVAPLLEGARRPPRRRGRRPRRPRWVPARRPRRWPG